ncbi:MAG: hypothetical protein WDN46_24140 [Methylocella sp.]
MDAILHQPPATFYFSINGVDCTEIFNRYLIKLVITSTLDGADTCEITLDDEYGQLQMPPNASATIVCGIGWLDTGAVESFSGYVDEPLSKGSRNGGRLLIISGISSSPSGGIKSTLGMHADNSSFLDAATKFGAAAGLTVSMPPGLGSVMRDYWSAHNEDFKAWGHRTARQFGAVMKIQGNQVVFQYQTSQQSASGEAMPDVQAVVGQNVINWALVPAYQTAQYAKFTTSWYDTDKALWNYEPSTLGGTGDPSAALNHKFVAPTQAQAQNQSDSNQRSSDWEKSGGTITIIGEPSAQAMGVVTLTGARPGIDGQYTIVEAIHSFDRNSGYITTLQVSQYNPVPPPSNSEGSTSESDTGDGEKETGGESTGQ